MPDEPPIEELRALRNELEALLGGPTEPSGVLPGAHPDVGDIVAPHHRRLIEDEPED